MSSQLARLTLVLSACDQPSPVPARGTTSSPWGELEAVSALFRALAHPTRVRVLIELQDAQRSPSELARAFADPRLSLPSVSYHVHGLVGAGLIELAFTTPRRGALEHSYGLTARGVAAIGALRALTTA
jgi:DNA-binding transcriptional ArsR family regulator